IKRMSRRDQFPGDWVELNLDSYHDLRSAFSFTVSASGVRGDEFVSNNGNNWESSWNPIWFAKTHIDEKGWTAEIKIPFSQLRFGKDPEKIWGFQITRRIFRKEERSIWQYIPQNSGVWVSGFGELHGLKDVKPQKQVEIAPYLVAKTETYKSEAENPFATGRDNKITVGLDGKVAVTSDLILDFTVNPDFGQVEADPSQVRIDGFQNFFAERRPFFIESRNIFDYQLTGSEAGDDYDSDLLFYSRRIGSSPHGTPKVNEGEFSQIPQNTSILGAVKFSGKTKKGWSVGLLESITQRVSAIIDKNGERRQEVIEPLSNYFVGRLQKDINGGQTVLGGIFTGVQRENNLNNLLHTGAYSGGLDFLHYWKNRTWYLRGNVVFSHVLGSKEKIYETQTGFEHLFQRSNAPETSVDANRTSLTGTGGTFRLGKSGGKSGKHGEVFKFETGVTYRSPELELNDIGFMLTANEINHFTWAGVQWQKQIGIFRNARINYNHFSRWDFGGQFLYQAFNTNMHGNFKNNWRVGTGATWTPYSVSNNALRGGSSLRQPAGINNWFYVQTDSRKKITSGLEVFNSWGFENTVRVNDVSLNLQAQPLNAITVSLGVGYTKNWRKQDQFVNNADFDGQSRIIVSEVDQNTMRFTMRLNYNITPDLTLQYYGQPFITRPIYKNFAYVTDPLNPTYDARFHRFTANEITFQDGMYQVDENQDGTMDYSFDKPDFNFVQFRSNLVARWEYKAGSEVYLVWSQGNTPDVGKDFDSSVGQSLFNNLFSGQARNIFLLKFTYRFLK
ncbi:MAG: carbohydrate binding family 9 domain-containing protein, partial [Verrucomicrobia bacterium]|nr:carbohydrate binding family 9 domain-containing protein [Cytophagales bacterium]